MRLWDRIRRKPRYPTPSDGEGVLGLPEGYTADDATINLVFPKEQPGMQCIDARCRRENPDSFVKLYGVGLSGSIYGCVHCGARW